MRSVHDANTWLLIGFNSAVGVWCLAAYRWRAVASRAMWLGVVVAQLTTVVQAVSGAVLANRDDVELDDMHALYGFSAIIAVAIMYSYRTSPFMRGKDTLLYGFGSLFVMGLGLRNLVLG